MTRIGPLWRTTAVRFAVGYAALFCLALGLGLGALYQGTIGVLERQRDATLESEVRALAERFRAGGPRALSRAIAERTGPEARGDTVYLLTGPEGRRLAGNLNAWPQEVGQQAGRIAFGVTKRDGEALTRRDVAAQAFRLAGGYKLLVGRDSGDLLEFRRRFQTVAIWVALGTVALALAGGAFAGRRVLARVAQAAEAGERVAAGNLDRRVPRSGRGDEFDRLADSVNAMLDRIEALMQGMRISTDSISHDVRRPLTRVRAELDLVLRRGDAGAAAEAAIGRALEEIDRATGILNDLLSIARAEAGVPSDQWRPLDLGQIARDAAELYAPVAEARGIALTVSAEPAPGQGEPQLLAQAAANLIDNALKYAPPGGGAVRVESGRTEGGPAYLAVSDNGPGIPEDRREAVTERFVRLDSARASEGAGLGLSLVRAVARLHGGRLDLSDNAPGLRARLCLPG
ncbi:MAG: HAMP domain-containing sensor histidine kinase [Pseudomonadota bacterium]